jgi:hypothetical protein
MLHVTVFIGGGCYQDLVIKDDDGNVMHDFDVEIEDSDIDEYEEEDE